MRMRLGFVCLLFGASTAGLAGCGDDSPTCGEGTALDPASGTCIASCGTGTMLVDGVCVANPGSTCGPGTVEQSGACVVDTTAPDPVTGLAAVVNGTNVDLAWTAGTNSTTTLVVRLSSGGLETPVLGTNYAVGDMLPGGGTVVAVGALTNATVSAATPGRYTYMAWSRNASGKYGFGREVTVVTAIPPQTGSISIDVAATTGTVTAQPANIALAVSNVAFNAGTLTFDLAATNNTAGAFYNTKAVVKTLSVGAVTQSGETDAGDSFLTFGLGAQLGGASWTRSVEITGVAATDTVTFDVELLESGFGVLGNDVFDGAGGDSQSFEYPSIRGSSGAETTFTTGFIAASGRYFYGLTRWSTGFYRLDSSDGDLSGVSPFPGNATGLCAFVGPDQFAYAIYGLGSHRGRSHNGIAIVRFDAATMTPVATATVFPQDTGAARTCTMNGTKVAISYGTQLFLADAATMQFIDADTATPDEIDPVDVGSVQTIRSLAFSLDGATVYAATNKSNMNIYAIDVATLTASTYHTASGGSRVDSLTIGSDGKLWWGGSDGLYSFDGSTQAKVPNYVDDVEAIGAVTGTKIMFMDGNATHTIDITDGSITRSGALVGGNRSGHRFTFFSTP
ncbi:MAG: hypothetical protein AB7P03_14305 [Kofleriaceae bacterium]